MSIAVFTLLFGICVALIVRSLWTRRRQMHALLAAGIPTSGKVTAKQAIMAKARQRYVLSYEYSPDGNIRKGRSIVSREAFERHLEGGSLPLRYLADQPSVSAPEFVIQQMRAGKAN